MCACVCVCVCGGGGGGGGGYRNSGTTCLSNYGTPGLTTPPITYSPTGHLHSLYCVVHTCCREGNCALMSSGPLLS